MYNKEATIKRKKESQLEQMKQIANEHVIREMFFEMFADLPLYKQKTYLDRAMAMTQQVDAEQIEQNAPLN